MFNYFCSLDNILECLERMFFISNTVGFDAKNEMLILTYWSKSLKFNKLQKLFPDRVWTETEHFIYACILIPSTGQLQYYPLHLFLLSFYLQKKRKLVKCKVQLINSFDVFSFSFLVCSFPRKHALQTWVLFSSIIEDREEEIISLIIQLWL